MTHLIYCNNLIQQLNYNRELKKYFSCTTIYHSALGITKTDIGLLFK